MALRALITAVILAILIWSGYWFVFSGIHKAAVENLVSDLRGEGKTAGYAGIRVRGFPNRFDTTIGRPAYFDPDSGLSWTADFVQILSLSYQPARIILAWPERQTISIAGEVIDITAENLRASLSFRTVSEPDLDTIIAESGPALLAGSSGWQIRFSEMLAALRRVGDTDEQLEFAARALLAPDGTAAAPGGWAEAFLDDFASLEIALEIGFDGPFSRELCDGGLTRLATVTIADSKLRWKNAQIILGGRLSVEGGRLSGTLTIDPGASGFSALFAKFPAESDGFPFNRQDLSAAAIFLDIFSPDGLQAQIRNGMLAYQDVEILPIPPVRLCPAG